MAIRSEGKGPGDSPDEPLIRAFIRDRFVDMFVSQSRRAQLGLLAAAGLIAFVWFERDPKPALIWISVALGVTLCRYRFTDRFVRAKGERHATKKIALLLFINGVLMAMPLTAFARLSDIERAAMSIILLATSAASVATTLGYRSIFLAFAGTMLVPLSGSWALVSYAEQSRWSAAGLSLLIFLFLLFLVSIGKQAQLVFEESSRFRYGEQSLNRELKQALENASEANRAKTQFLAAASHDLRQPIHSMNVLVAALTLRRLDGSSREIVRLLDSVNQMLSKQLDGLLDISKLDAGIIKPAPMEQRLDHIITSHHAALAPMARERGLNSSLGSIEEVCVSTDAALFLRILSNLTDNALKFTRRGGTISLSVLTDGTNAVVSVSDTGIGIPAEEHERVFREFYQVGNVERDRSKGLGLGLSIVHRLCTLLHIELQLQSQPGIGTTVLLRMPIVASTAAPAEHCAPSRMASGLTVLVVDDEQMVRDSMRILLTELGCTAFVADGSEQAKAVALEHAIDVVLSDHRLRGTDSGLRAMRTVQAIHPRVRPVLITGDTAPDRIQEAEAAGVPLLHKPVTLGDLVSVLQRDGSSSRAPACTEDTP